MVVNPRSGCPGAPIPCPSLSPCDNTPSPKGFKAMTKEQPTHQERIVQDPRIMVGKPVVRGTRIPVEKVLDQLAYKPDFAEVFAIWPELTVEDVRACLAYAGRAVAGKRLHRPAEADEARPAHV